MIYNVSAYREPNNIDYMVGGALSLFVIVFSILICVVIFKIIKGDL